MFYFLYTLVIFDKHFVNLDIVYTKHPIELQATIYLLNKWTVFVGAPQSSHKTQTYILYSFSTRDRSVGSKDFSISRESDFNVSARVLSLNLARKPKSEVIYKTLHILSPNVKLFRCLKGVRSNQQFLFVKCIQQEILSAIFFAEDTNE